MHAPWNRNTHKVKNYGRLFGHKSNSKTIPLKGVNLKKKLSNTPPINQSQSTSTLSILRPGDERRYAFNYHHRSDKKVHFAEVEPYYDNASPSKPQKRFSHDFFLNLDASSLPNVMSSRKRKLSPSIPKKEKLLERLPGSPPPMVSKTAQKNRKRLFNMRRLILSNSYDPVEEEEDLRYLV